MSEGHGNGGDGPATQLDHALAAADRGDAEAQAFYDVFLNARLYVPTAEDEPGSPAGTVNLLVADVDDEGIVPAFDSEARLTDWAERDAPFTVLPGHALIEQLDPTLQLALNVGTKHFKLFVETELAWLRERLGETVTDLEPNDQDEAADFKTTDPPGALVDAMIPAFRRNELVAVAFLVESEQPAAGKTRRFTLVLDVGDADDAVFAELARDIGIAARSGLGTDEYMDIIAFNPLEGVGRALLEKAVDPVFARLPEDGRA